MVPIRSIGPRERERIARHLLALTPHDRYLRFGYAAADEQVQRYVDSLDFERDELFGIYNRRLELIAMAHLAFAPGDQHSDCAEFGVSVSRTHAAAATAPACSSAPWSWRATKAWACSSSMR
jgi:hypothetical protein